MRKIIGLFFITLGCSSATNGAPSSSETSKLAAAEAHAKGTSTDDSCASNAWYGDGECDTFCANTDTDCIPKNDDTRGEPILCAEFIENSDGVCSRKDSDACRFQDPDCGKQGTVCAAISELPDGTCGRKADDPCRSQDPDCNEVGSSDVDCDLRQIKCQTFAPVMCGDGKVPSVVNGCYGPCVDKTQCAASKPDGSGGTGNGGGAPSRNNCDLSQITCKTLLAVTCPDGQVPTVLNECYGPCIDKDECAPREGSGSGSGGSSAGGGDGKGGDTAKPEGGSTANPNKNNCDLRQIQCQTFAPVTCPDGAVPTVVDGCYGPCVTKSECAEIPSEPAPAHVDCDQRKITCQTFAPVICPEGEVPSVINNCYGPCVKQDRCEPIACAAYIEESDGVCKRPDTDPCRGQDPDCIKR